MKLPGIASIDFKSKPFESVAFLLLVILTFLIPLFFIPASPSIFLFSKSFLIGFVVLISLLLVIASELKDRKVVVPYSYVFLSVWLLPLAYLLSAVFSSNMRASLVGQTLGTDTFGFILFGALLVTLSVLLLKESKRALLFYGGLFVSGIVLTLFHFVRFVAGPETLSFGVLNTTSSTPIGVWNDLAVFFGLLTVISIVTLMARTPRKIISIFLYITVLVSLFFLALVNFSAAWWMVGFFALAMFVYSVVASGSKKNIVQSADMITDITPVSATSKQTGISFISLLVLAVSLVFIFFGSGIGEQLADRFNTSFIDVRPSWESTIDIGKLTYAETPVFGSGANTFNKQWLIHKPAEINESLFWNTRFSGGISFIPTSFITTGLVGMASWIIFLFFFLFAGVKTFVLGTSRDDFVYYLSLSSFLGALYLWVASMLYTPSVALLMFAFLFTGIFIGSLRARNSFKELTISFTDNPRLGFIAVLALTVIFLGSISGLFSIGEKYLAANSFQQAVLVGNRDGDLEGARAHIRQAVLLDANDQYYRLAADIAVADLNRLVADNTTPSDDIRNQFQSLVAEGVQNAQAAIQLDSTNDQNWFALARIYQIVAPLQIEGAYENGVRAFEEALVYNPLSPSLYLERAQLELGVGNLAKGEEFINQAIEKKSNYTEAIFLLAQVQIANGNVRDAIDSVRSAVFFDSSNPVGFFQLGLLEYSEGNNANAVAALGQAVSLDKNYSNARYFLGLAHYRLGNTEESLAQFEAIAVLNPDNEEIKQVLENLRAGDAPVPGIPFQTVDDIEALPVAETQVTQ